MSSPTPVALQADPSNGAQASGGDVLDGVPSLNVRDVLWLIVVCAFVVVLLASVAMECVFVFVFPNSQSPQVLLILFTAGSAFLGGLFAPIPFSTNHAPAAPATPSATPQG